MNKEDVDKLKKWFFKNAHLFVFLVFFAWFFELSFDRVPMEQNWLKLTITSLIMILFVIQRIDANTTGGCSK